MTTAPQPPTTTPACIRPLPVETARSVAYSAIMACVVCGKPHAYRPDPRHEGFNTWADPVDGHSYRTSILGMDRAVAAEIAARVIASLAQPAPSGEATDA